MNVVRRKYNHLPDFSCFSLTQNFIWKISAKITDYYSVETSEVGGLTFLAFGLDWRSRIAVFTDAGVRHGRDTVLVFLTLGEVRHRRRLTDDRRLLHLLPVAERRPLLELISCNDGP